MIQNSRQYSEARRELGKWTALKSRLSELAVAFSLDERDLMEFMDARINRIDKSLKEYQNLQFSDSENLDILRQVAKLPTSLIKARIVLNWTQTDLAKRTGLKVQQVHRYEKLNYSSIKLSRAIEIALLLDAALSDRAAELQELHT
jgi:DNA-binding XRE family transcriptional regulator